MNKKLLAGLTAAGVLAGGASAAALITGGGAAPASATAAAAVRSTPQVLCTGSALTSLVRKGTITQAQATAVRQALWTTNMRDHSGRMGEHMGGVRHYMGDMDGMWANGPMATALRQLVNQGTITKAQATAITSAITQQMRTHWGHGHSFGMMTSHGAGSMGSGHMG